MVAGSARARIITLVANAPVHVPRLDARNTRLGFVAARVSSSCCDESRAGDAPPW